MSFEKLQLSPSIMKAITDCGYTEPTPIQERAIPVVLTGSDLIASAQTGTGKTAAFILPALHRLGLSKGGRGRGPRVLVLTPTRELATQVADAVKNYGKYNRVRSAVILGGMPYREQLRLLSQPLDIVVGTPGRLNDHLERQRIDLSRVELLILDEADRMLDMGFIEDVEKIAGAAPQERQTLLFSATLDERIKRLASGILKDPEVIMVAGKQEANKSIEQRLLVADNLDHKNSLLRHLIKDDGLTQAIVFSATKRDAESMAVRLRSEGHSAAPLHGDMKQTARNRTITDLRRGKIRVLIATDVAARGIDVAGVSHVINFDLPKFAEDYIHRIGRTGRAGASGIAISFVSHGEVDCLKRIERYIGKDIPQHVIPGLEPSLPLVKVPERRKSRGQAMDRKGGWKPGGKKYGSQERNPKSGSGSRKGPGRQDRPVLVEYRSSRRSEQ